MTNAGTSLERPSGNRSGDLAGEVRRIFAELTRYPAEVLDPQADLEEELGLDSVKLGEILSALRERFHLPPISDIRSQFPPERLRTIGGISEVVSALAPRPDTEATAPPPSPAAAPPQPAPVVPAATSPELLDELRGIFADLTRYPVDILAPDSDLEEELGIDSVKLGEIFSVLRERYSLPPRNELRERIRAEQLRTIAGIAGVVRSFGDTGEATPAAPPAAGPARPPLVPDQPAVPDTNDRLHGFTLVQSSEGRVVLSAEKLEAGFAPALLEAALAAAVQSTLPAGSVSTILALHVLYAHAPGREGGAFSAEAEFVSAEGRVATVQGRLLDARGTVCAHATGTCLISTQESSER